MLLQKDLLGKIVLIFAQVGVPLMVGETRSLLERVLYNLWTRGHW
jgi:hypothetical protein